MDALKKLLYAIYHAADSQIPQLAGDLFSQLVQFYTECEKIKVLTNPIPVNLAMWDEIGDRLAVLLNFHQCGYVKNIVESKKLYQIIKDYENEARKRGKILKEISHILAPESIEYYLKLTNINPNTFRSKIKQFWDKLDTPENQTYLIKKSHFNLKPGNLTRQIIDHEMKLLSFNISLIEDKDSKKGKELRNEFDALKVAISQYYRHQIDKTLADKHSFSHSSMYALNDFENCSLCWRFVPKKDRMGNKKPYCEFHNYDPASNVSQTEYNLALKFRHNKTYHAENNNPEHPPPLP